MRDLISVRSNSAKPPSTVGMSLPWGVVVSAQVSASESSHWIFSTTAYWPVAYCATSVPKQALNESFLNTAIKDDEKLVDEAIAAVYDQMISFDGARADQVIRLIIRRHREAKDAFKTLLSDVSERQPKNLQLRVA